jgi:hypothetical protein
MDSKLRNNESRDSSPAVPGNSGTVPAKKDLNPTQEGAPGAQDSQPVHGEHVHDPRHPDTHLSQKPFPQG